MGKQEKRKRGKKGNTVNGRREMGIGKKGIQEMRKMGNVENEKKGEI